MILLINPMEVADWLDRRYPQVGVRVMEKVGGPSWPLWDWIAARLASQWLPGKATLRRAVEEYGKEFPHDA